MIQLTDKILATVFPQSTAENRAKYLRPLNDTIIRYGIAENAHRLRAFLAQIGVESGQLKACVENLNYSASRLQVVFPRMFPTLVEAQRVAAGGPEAIANRIYGNRLGNTLPGDGWKYRGRGLIQLTGKTNYTAASRGMYALPMGVDFVDEPDLVATPQYAAESAGWFWADYAKLNTLADQLAIQGKEYAIFTDITKRINGGTNGLAERWALYNNAKKVIL